MGGTKGDGIEEIELVGLREKKFELQISSLNKDVQYYRSQSKSIKKSGEQGIKQIMAVVDGKIEKEKYARHSLPNLDRK